MDSTASVAIRQQLLEERQRLQDQLRELGAGGDGSTDLSYDANFADSSQVTAERGEVAALVATLGERLDEVERAIAKDETGSYGRCEACDGQIPAARLEAMPTSRLCIGCANAAR